MTKFHPRCGYLGCDPKVGECLGFCDKSMRPIPEDDEQEEGKGMEMLALALILTLFALLIGLSLYQW